MQFFPDFENNKSRDLLFWVPNFKNCDMPTERVSEIRQVFGACFDQKSWLPACWISESAFHSYNLNQTAFVVTSYSSFLHLDSFLVLKRWKMGNTLSLKRKNCSFCWWSKTLTKSNYWMDEFWHILALMNQVIVLSAGVWYKPECT